MRGRSVWQQEFRDNLRRLPFAKQAWEKLSDAGMGDFAEDLLYQLYAFEISVAAEIGIGLGEINSRLEKLDYADRAARKRRGEPPSEGFAKKREKALENTARADWPFRNQQVTTFAHATSTYPVAGTLPLERAMAAIGDGRQALQHYRGKQLLVVLRAGAKARGIHVSLTQLSELTYAAMIYAAGEGANPKPLDKNTLQRFFAFPDIERLERAFQRRFEASEEWDLEAIAASIMASALSRDTSHSASRARSQGRRRRSS